MEIVIVIAIIGILAAVTVVALKPQEIFANGRNARRTHDVASLNTAISQWIAREGVREQDPYAVMGLLDTGVTSLTPSDGSIVGEGVDATTVSQLALPAYLQIIPKDPDGTTEYRVGVDDVSSPSHILVCTDQIEHTTTFSESNYPNGIFCQST